VYTAQEQAKVNKVLGDLQLLHDQSVVVIDARNENNPSALPASAEPT
jgi:hypothetical protein